MKIINSPFWEIYPMKSTNVYGIYILTQWTINRGFDWEYSKNVLLKSYVSTTEADCMALKSERDTDAKWIGIKSENIMGSDFLKTIETSNLH